MYDLDLVKRLEQESAVYVLNNGQTDWALGQDLVLYLAAMWLAEVQQW